ncbi:hypothetical protein ABUE31_05095 [Mesorhizobium sp. ZMM04-5]|uniref:Uncharacterized protein n=1 Tax=Mesorhizobium marinum TaxID=3228790 RepID=A0ABV3QX39_9HYPH
MVESLLSISNINLFGHPVIDIMLTNFSGATSITVASRRKIKTLAKHITVNGVPVTAGDKVLVWKQNDPEANEIYLVKGDTDAWDKQDTNTDDIFDVEKGSKYKGYFKKREDGFEYIGDKNRRPGAGRRMGANKLLEDQFEKGRFARIYGFSFEGTYYDLPRPIVFLVHGDGDLVSEDLGSFGPARSPSPTSLTGLAAADFDFADGLRVWSYDKADYTIRMDVETGMFEDVLLAAMFGGGPGGMDSAGMNARGMNARGMNARGMNARGMNARGMNARGGGNSD